MKDNFIDEVVSNSTRSSVEIMYRCGMYAAKWHYYRKVAERGLPLDMLTTLQAASGLSDSKFYSLLKKHYPKKSFDWEALRASELASRKNGK